VAVSRVVAGKEIQTQRIQKAERSCLPLRSPSVLRLPSVTGLAEP
jgi:hypothetical protein